MQVDVAIVGAGPAGLSFARSLAGTGLSIALIERQSQDALAAPAFDGREIALTYRSVRILKGLGAWERIAEDDKAVLREARVLNGASRFALRFDGLDQLGWLVPNHRIREALYGATEGQEGVEWVTGATVARAWADRRGAGAELGDGRRIDARLLVAADSRFSGVRDQLGIGADVNRLGKTMIVCRVQHDRDNGAVATEWFDHHQTLALLPLGPHRASAVLTVVASEAERLMTMDEAAFGRELTRRYHRRMGEMRVASSRHAYPLVTTWSHHFAGHRAALIGDAAVGMHPVTAHGFNLGLSGQELLAGEMRLALRRGRDWAGDAVLRRYEAGHRRAARPLYTGTNLLVRLFTDERMPARVARDAALRIGAWLPPVRMGVRAALAG